MPFARKVFGTILGRVAIHTLARVRDDLAVTKLIVLKGESDTNPEDRDMLASAKINIEHALDAIEDALTTLRSVEPIIIRPMSKR